MAIASAKNGELPTVVCVLGMHRSGTSVATGMLARVGAYLGPESDLVAPRADNPRGFFESQTIVDLNKGMLMRLGGHSLAPPIFPTGWHRAPWLADLRREAELHIERSYADADVWAWKDPRACLTLPFWQDVMPPMKYVICMRRPEDVAYSLQRRNRTSLERGLYLWLVYTLSALRHTQDQPQCLVSFDRLIDEPTTELRRLATFIGTPERAEPPEAGDAVAAFIDPDLRHHRGGRTRGTKRLDSGSKWEQCLALAEHGYEILAHGHDGDWPIAAAALEESLNALRADPAAGVLEESQQRTRGPLVSIIVNNFNYHQFLTDSIDSALGQTFPNVEVIVVDDGSTDDSREIVASYADRIIPVLKNNGGQASAFNAGFAASTGKIVIFLDADDVLMPTAAERAVRAFAAGVVKVHWPLWRVNPDLSGTGKLIPAEDLPAGNLSAMTFADGPASSLSPPTSGNAWARDFLDQVMPVPEENHRIGADGYLYGLAPAFGAVARIQKPQALYRVHETNNYKHLSLESRLNLGLRCIEDQWKVLRAYARHEGRPVNEARWEQRSYFHQLQAAIGDLESVLPGTATVILMDEGRWAAGDELSGRSIIPFLERDGYYNGVPESDRAAIHELERLRAERGANYLVVAWPAFWWMGHFVGFAEHIRSRYASLISNSRLAVFSLGAID